tara:strand:- start:48 stop:1388 length:1341 start_codon:yes stop_codon:yes gene_type:complete
MSGESKKSSQSLATAVIASNNGTSSVDISNGLNEVRYYESILSDTRTATLVYIDSGGSINGKSTLDGLPITGGEKVILKIKDLNDKKIVVNNNNALYVNQVTPLSENTNNQIVSLELKSKEYFLNNKIRVSKKFTGKISNNIGILLRNYLESEKQLHIEETLDNYNFIGNLKKPFYLINWLSKRSTPQVNSNALGKTAGFFFFETSEGYHFKSIDSLLDEQKNPPKRNIIYNNTPDEGGKDIPKRYTTKALTFQKGNLVNLGEKYKVGAFSSKIISFDPFSCFYEVRRFNNISFEDSYRSAGIDLPRENKELIPEGSEEKSDFSRTTYYLMDTGTLPDGNVDQQLSKSKDENFKSRDIANQAIMRYNLLFSSKIEITIAGDFELHAGDSVFFDSAELTSTSPSNVNEQSGGLYIISELCHFVSASGTFTKLNLIRDSFGRKGTPGG